MIFIIPIPPTISEIAAMEAREEIINTAFHVSPAPSHIVIIILKSSFLEMSCVRMLFMIDADSIAGLSLKVDRYLFKLTLKASGIPGSSYKC